MEHSCSRCGAAVDDSSPFCPACEAPQVSYVPREPEPGQEAPRLHPATVPPPHSPPIVSEYYAPSNRAVAAPRQGSFLRTAIYAGAIGGLLSLVPGLALIGLPLAGVLALKLFRMQNFGADIRPKLGIRLGALSGLCAFILFAPTKTAELALSGDWLVQRQTMVDRIHQAQAADPNPQLQPMYQFLLTPPGITLIVLFGLLLMCAVFVLLAGLGGLISASIQQRKPPH